MTPRPPRRRFVPLQAKFLWGTVAVIGLLMVGVVGIVERRQRGAIIEEVQRRGLVLAESLAAVSTGPLLLYNFTALEQNVARLDREGDVAYAVVLDADGRVAAHSPEPARVGAVPADPATRRAVAAAAPLVQEVTGPRGEALYDFAVPIHVERQRWGTVRLGLTRARMEAQIARTRVELALLGGVALVVGGLLSALVARRIARPLRRLAEGAAAISRGDLDQRIEPAASDEVGRLALAFNEMVDRLRQQRAELATADGELRRRFAELSDLKRYTDHILGSLGSGIVTLDLEGRVVTVNPAAERLTGCLGAEVRGRFCTEAFARLPELRDLLVSAVAGSPAAEPVSLGLSRPGRDPIPVEAAIAPLRGAEGQPVGLVAALRDLTAVRRLEEQLRRSDRLAAIGTLAAGLAHEIKNPLTSVLTFSRHLARRFGDERFRQRYQSVVPRELERINGIVDGLLRLARPTRLSLAPVHVTQLLDQALELYGPQAEARQARVVREYTVGLPAIPADPEHLYQALVNLVANAVEALADGGTLTVRAGWGGDGPGAGPGVAGWGRPGRAHLRVEVEDTGSGIPPEATASVFNPFFTTKPGGTGLGLAIAHKIVEDHGGTIGFRSVPGRGTTFTVRLPLVAGPGAELPAERAGDPDRTDQVDQTDRPSWPGEAGAGS